ncbi:hypothetical protein AVEN_239136-1 [Araneus ventricosus]|uniref:Uncharacterized protein n=1 Tax=Araneus ventricosus TaxID=182803 RepID=A0A4Y2NQ46_ARAVE|nr:hypothetical protein AVEN_239136-1 [Araneus ventricosus]
MYRQIWSMNQIEIYKRILWNQFVLWETYGDHDKATYGTTCTVLATRALKALAEEETKVNFPPAATLTDACVDDILSGSNNLEETKVITTSVNSTSKKGGMELHKCFKPS